MSFLQKRFISITHALRGGATMLKTQPNARLHLVATFGALGLGIAFQITFTEWVALSLAMALVWIAESINTAIEFLADEISLERKELIGMAKDVAAFAVLTSAIFAIIIGFFVFAPYLFGLFLIS